MTQLAVADIDQHILRLFDMVAEGLTAATTAFLECDRDMARTLIAGDQSIDSLQDVTEELLYAELDRALAHRDREVRSVVGAKQPFLNLGLANFCGALAALSLLISAHI